MHLVSNQLEELHKGDYTDNRKYITWSVQECQLLPKPFLQNRCTCHQQTPMMDTCKQFSVNYKSKSFELMYPQSMIHTDNSDEIKKENINKTIDGLMNWFCTRPLRRISGLIKMNSITHQLNANNPREVATSGCMRYKEKAWACLVSSLRDICMTLCTSTCTIKGASKSKTYITNTTVADVSSSKSEK
jgi:hypothetical protein